MQSLEELIAALEKAQGMDRELDLQIGLLVDGWEYGDVSKDFSWSPFVGRGFVKDHEGNINSSHPGGMYPSYTESFDAALGLLQRVKPGWFWRGGYVPAGKYERGDYQHGWGHISRTDASNCDRHDEFTGWAATPTLALLIATLRAKLQQEKNNAQ